MAVGETRAAGFQAGARRTFPLTADEAWGCVCSPAGARCWLGEPPPALGPDAEATLADGTHVAVRLWKDGSHLRLARTPAGGPTSVVQVRVVAADDDRAVIAFHEEQRANGPARSARLQWYTRALDALEALACGR